MNYREVIEHPESSILEFKAVLPSNEKVAQVVCAFANGVGGTLVIGVDDKSRDVIGVSESDIFELEERITNIVIGWVQPIISPIITTYNSEGKYLLLVQIDRGQHKPYYLKKYGLKDGTYIRVGSSTRKATPDIIAELERERLNISYDSTPVYNSSPDDLSSDHIKFYLEKRKEVRDIPLVKVTDDWLVKTKILYGEGGKLYPTVAGILLFSDRVNEYFPQGVIKCGRFKGADSTDFLDQKEYRGPIIYLLEKVLTFFKEHIPRSAKITGAYREERYAFPEVAIREAVVNAICHRDYSIGGSDIKFAIYDDIIEVTSPGTLPGSLTVEDLGTGISELRNRVVGRIFNEIGLIEGWGTGFNRIRRNLEEYGLPMPEVNLKGRFFQVSFKRGGFNRNINSPSAESLNSLEGRIIELIEERGKVQTKDCIQAIPEKSEKTIRRKLKGLEGKNIIRWCGSSRTDPTGYYVLMTE